jgi:hypothetical protein
LDWADKIRSRIGLNNLIRSIVPEAIAQKVFDKKKKTTDAWWLEVEPFGNSFRLINVAGKP